VTEPEHVLVTGAAGAIGAALARVLRATPPDPVKSALEHDEPRVIYPGVYGVGWTAPNLSSWIALSYGPPPVS
jgi:hypothetical protein